MYADEEKTKIDFKEKEDHTQSPLDTLLCHFQEISGRIAASIADLTKKNDLIMGPTLTLQADSKPQEVPNPYQGRLGQLCDCTRTLNDLSTLLDKEVKKYYREL